MTPGSPGFHSPTGSNSIGVTAACRSRRLIRNHQSTVNISRLKFYLVYSCLPVTQTASETINRQQFGLPSPSMPGNRHRRGTTNRPISAQKHPAQRCVPCSRLPVTRATVANLGVLPPLEVCGVTCNRSSVELWPTRHLKHLLFRRFRTTPEVAWPARYLYLYTAWVPLKAYNRGATTETSFSSGQQVYPSPFKPTRADACKRNPSNEQPNSIRSLARAWAL